MSLFHIFLTQRLCPWSISVAGDSKDSLRAQVISNCGQWRAILAYVASLQRQDSATTSSSFPAPTAFRLQLLMITDCQAFLHCPLRYICKLIGVFCLMLHGIACIIGQRTQSINAVIAEAT